MKQVVQRLRDGRIEILEVPPPDLRPEGVLVAVRASLLSAGTERKKVQTGRQTLVGKARARPDQVRQVLEKARRDGVKDTVRAVRFRLEQPSALGYSAAGVVIAVGERVRDLAPGDRVACAGEGYATHAEVDYVPANLTVRIPDHVDFGQAAFATLGAIALHGVRQTDAGLGERVAVIGLGLVGQLAGQILRAAGCNVVGVDLSPDLVRRALDVGAADAAFARADLDDRELPAEARDCDAMLVTAATSSSDPVRLAGRLSRDRGRVVIVGDVGIDLPRHVFYGKELELRLSRSYGPGRYDFEYEERGLDYPVGYVRWTERRNMEAFLDLVAAGKVRVEPLISDRLPVEQAPAAYDRLVSSATSPLGILLEYEDTAEPAPPPASPPTSVVTTDVRSVGVVGAGSFANRVLIPALRDAGFDIRAVASATGLSARAAADRLRIARVTTADEALSDPDLGLVAIATRHGSHAALATQALRAGKHVFVEKPPALTGGEAEELCSLAEEQERVLMPGHLLIYHPGVKKLKELVESGQLGETLYLYGNRQNLGQIRKDENALWSLGVHDLSVILHLVGEEPAEVWARGESFLTPGVEDVVFCYLRFPSGPVAHMHLSWLDPHKMRRMTVVGRDRMAVFDDMELERKITVFDKAPEQPPGRYGEWRTRTGDIYSPKIPTDEPLRLECQHFLALVGGAGDPHRAARDGAAVVRVLEQLQHSLEATLAA